VIRRDTDILRLDLRDSGTAFGDLALADLEAVRLVLRGGSPIDWHRLNLQTLSDVDDLLRANLMDPDDPRDFARLEYLHREAIRYLKRNFAFRFPVEVEHPADVRHLFLYASEVGRLNRVQVLSCVVLKVVHTINHLEARALLQQTSVTEAELLELVEQQVLRRAEALTAEGLPVVRFYGSRKGRDSMVSKLLSKKAARAADILDRLRFRLVVENRDDIVPTLAWMLRYCFPWNHITAGESSNNLVSLSRWVRDAGQADLLERLQVDPGLEAARALDNEFSGASFKMINFVIDVPVRLDHLLSRAGDPWVLQKGSICYLPCEFQVVDQETAWLNEQGENSHARYKQRQADRVGDRLMWGLKTEGRAERPGRTSPLARKPKSLSALERAHRPSDPAAVPVRRPARAPRPALPGTSLETPPDGLLAVVPPLEEDTLIEGLRSRPRQEEDSLLRPLGDPTGDHPA